MFGSAAKYKAYGRLRALESSTDVEGNEIQESRSQQAQHLHSKRKHDFDRKNGFTPRKNPKHELSTPSNGRTYNIHPSQLDPYDSPSTLRRLFSPQTDRQGQLSPPLKTAIGPTPQRDGKALGIFDLLSASGGSAATPSAKRAPVESRENIQTPSRRKKMDTILEEDEEIPREGRTPASSSKRWYLEKLFATPTTLRYASIVEDEESDTRRNAVKPMSVNGVAPEPLESGTPPFLRRSHSGRLTSNPTSGALDLSPVAVRKPPIFIGKGLTALVQGLRDMEEEENWEDLEALREVEERAARSENTVEVGDSQALGNEAGKPNRIWKKKGQKRTTRRVKMKPLPLKSNPGAHVKNTKPSHDEDELATSSAPAPASPQTPRTCEESNGEEGEDDTISVNRVSEADPELGTDPDYNADACTGKLKSRGLSEKIKAAFSVVKNVKSKGEKSVKSMTAPKEKKSKQSTAKKINVQAHTNYRSLKLRNKENRRGGGRFSRRR